MDRTSTPAHGARPSPPFLRANDPLQENATAAALCVPTHYQSLISDGHREAFE